MESPTDNRHIFVIKYKGFKPSIVYIGKIGFEHRGFKNDSQGKQDALKISQEKTNILLFYKKISSEFILKKFCITNCCLKNTVNLVFYTI